MTMVGQGFPSLGKGLSIVQGVTDTAANLKQVVAPQPAVPPQPVTTPAQSVGDPRQKADVRRPVAGAAGDDLQAQLVERDRRRAEEAERERREARAREEERRAQAEAERKARDAQRAEALRQRAAQRQAALKAEQERQRQQEEAQRKEEEARRAEAAKVEALRAKRAAVTAEKFRGIFLKKKDNIQEIVAMLEKTMAGDAKYSGFNITEMFKALQWDLGLEVAPLLMKEGMNTTRKDQLLEAISSSMSNITNQEMLLEVVGKLPTKLDWMGTGTFGSGRLRSDYGEAFYRKVLKQIEDPKVADAMLDRELPLGELLIDLVKKLSEERKNELISKARERAALCKDRIVLEGFYVGMPLLDALVLGESMGLNPCRDGKKKAGQHLLLESECLKFSEQDSSIIPPSEGTVTSFTITPEGWKTFLDCDPEDVLAQIIHKYVKKRTGNAKYMDYFKYYRGESGGQFDVYQRTPLKTKIYRNKLGSIFFYEFKGDSENPDLDTGADDGEVSETSESKNVENVERAVSGKSDAGKADDSKVDDTKTDAKKSEVEKKAEELADKATDSALSALIALFKNAKAIYWGVTLYALVIGAVMVFVGQRYFKTLLFLVGFFFGYVIAHFFASETTSLICGGVAGLVMVFFYPAFVFLMGVTVWAVVCVACGITEPGMVHSLIAGVLGVLAFIFRRHVLIPVTAWSGAWMMAVGLALLFGKMNQYVFVALGLLFTVLGTFVQYKFTARDVSAKAKEAVQEIPEA